MLLKIVTGTVNSSFGATNQGKFGLIIRSDWTNKAAFWQCL